MSKSTVLPPDILTDTRSVPIGFAQGWTLSVDFTLDHGGTFTLQKVYRVYDQGRKRADITYLLEPEDIDSIEQALYESFGSP